MSDTRTILVEHVDGTATKVSDIPGNAKITFGPVSPAKGGFGHNVLRIYTSESNQLAVFQDVESFRDLSLTIAVREVTTEHSDQLTVNPRGVKSRSHRSSSHGVFTPVEDIF